jgi:hypothetical protein
LLNVVVVWGRGRDCVWEAERRGVVRVWLVAVRVGHTVDTVGIISSGWRHSSRSDQPRAARTITTVND